MVIVVVTCACVALALLGRLSYLKLQRRRTPEELRGDWWTRFEHDFRAYEHQRLRARHDPRPVMTPRSASMRRRRE
jgi:hypothetical protein